MPLKRPRSPSKLYNDSDPCFYADFKERYMKQMKEIFGDSDDDGGKHVNVHPCTRREVERLIEILKTGHKASNTCCAKVSHLYAIRFNKVGDEILTLENRFAVPFVQVLGYEDAFDHLFRIHVENKHNCFSNLLKIIKKKYHIPLLCYKKFIRLCQSKYFCRKKSSGEQLDSGNQKRKVVNKKRKADNQKRNTDNKKRKTDKTLSKSYTETSQQSSKQSILETKTTNVVIAQKRKSTKLTIQKNVPTFNSNVYVYVLNMNLLDGDFTHLLIYYDCNTQFHILRPLMELHVDEISVELMKIFGDFGPPLLYTVCCGQKAFFESVFNQLREVWHLNVSLHTIDDVLPSMFHTVRSELDRWMKETKSSSWGIGCHVVQWLLNERQAPVIGHSHFYTKAGSHRSINNRATTVLSNKPRKIAPTEIRRLISNEPFTSKTANVGNFKTSIAASDSETENEEENEKEDTNGKETDVTFNTLPARISEEDLWLKEDDTNSQPEMTYDLPENIPQEEMSYDLPENILKEETSCVLPEDMQQREASYDLVEIIPQKNTSFVLPVTVPQDVCLKIEDDEDDTGTTSSTTMHIDIPSTSSLANKPTMISGGASLTPISNTVTKSEEPASLSPTKLLSIERPDITVVVCHECSLAGTLDTKCERCSRKVHEECSAPFVTENEMGVALTNLLCYTCKSIKELQTIKW